MKTKSFLCLAVAFAAFAKSASASDDAPPTIMRSAIQKPNRFVNVENYLSKSDISAKIDVFTSFSCEHMAVVSNEASSPILLWCSSGDEDVKEIQVVPNEAFVFTFKPKKNGKSVFRCVLNYEKKWATFAVYDEEEVYSAPRENSFVYRYSVRSDGIYMNNKHKIKSFYSSYDDEIIYDYYNSEDLVSQNTTFRVAQKSKAISDRFSIIRANLSKEELTKQIEEFSSSSCERLVVLSNDASTSFRLWCSSGDDSFTDKTVNSGKSLTFSFKPKQNGNSRFKCIVQYKGKWVNFDVFNGTESCTCEQQSRYVFRYSIRNTGVYSENNSKIRSLFNGRNQYTLWESYQDYNEMPYGKLMTGFVDGPNDCVTVPWNINDKSAAITVCDYQCVYAYENIKCDGRRQYVQAPSSGCKTVKLEPGLYKGLSSVKGC